MKGNLREVVKVYNWQMIGCVGNKEEGIDESELLCEQENGGGDAPGNGKRFGRFGHSKLSTSKHCTFRDSFTEWLLSWVFFLLFLSHSPSFSSLFCVLGRCILKELYTLFLASFWVWTMRETDRRSGEIDEVKIFVPYILQIHIFSKLVVSGHSSAPLSLSQGSRSFLASGNHSLLLLLQAPCC